MGNKSKKITKNEKVINAALKVKSWPSFFALFFSTDKENNKTTFYKIVSFVLFILLVAVIANPQLPKIIFKYVMSFFGTE